jgi:hypothetical protein
MRESDEKLELAASRCASLAEKCHRPLSGFTFLEKSDIAFLIAADFRTGAGRRAVVDEGNSV